MTNSNVLSDLPTRAFLTLREKFFDENGKPISFKLREKSSTQDDPLDEYISQILREKIEPSVGVIKATSLVSPDIVVFEKELVSSENCQHFEGLDKIFALEVKKLNRTGSGTTARKSGLDYNSTPPCGKVRVYSKEGNKVEIRAFYAFVCQEEAESGICQLTALILCDGGALNKDFGLYLSAIETREKEIHLGTYRDGLNRNRPMFVFGNPLGLQEMDYKATIIHPADNLDKKNTNLGKVFRLIRSCEGHENVFWCYRLKSDIDQGHKVEDLYDFPTPKNRTVKTQSRGRLVLPF